MPWRGPEYEGDFPSLGYALLDLYAELDVPSGPMAGEPFIATQEQAEFVVRWYAIRPDTPEPPDRRPTGRVYRRGSLRRPKKWGKSPLAAALGFGELVGPVVFDGWDANGEPVGRPHPSPVVWIAACSEEQGDRTTYSALRQMLVRSTLVDDFGIDLMKSGIELIGRPGKLEAITASSDSAEGTIVSCGLLDEPHLWTPSNGGRELAATIRRNAAPQGGTTLELTNAYLPGQESVAEMTHKSFLDGAPGILYDSREGPEVDDLKDLDALRASMEVAYGDNAHLVGLDRLVEEAQDADLSDAHVRRFYLNQVVQGVDRWIDPAVWASLAA